MQMQMPTPRCAHAIEQPSFHALFLLILIPACVHRPYFVPSLLTTSSSNLIKKTVFPGHIPPSSPALCALTPALHPTPQQTPSTIPATYAAQFNCDISFGTDIYWFTKGSLSEIMYSWLLVEELSIESAERAKRCRHRVCAMNCKRGRMRVGRGAGWVGVEERRSRRGRRRWPRG